LENRSAFVLAAAGRKKQSSPFLKKGPKTLLSTRVATAGQKFFASFFKKEDLTYLDFASSFEAISKIGRSQLGLIAEVEALEHVVAERGHFAIFSAD